MVTKYYGKMGVDFTEGEYDRLEEIRVQRNWEDEHRASDYFHELKILRERQQKVLKDLKNSSIME